MAFDSSIQVDFCNFPEIFFGNLASINKIKKGKKDLEMSFSQRILTEVNQ